MTAAGLLQTFLMSSYLYYQQNISVITDSEFDQLCRELLKVWHTLKHQHKYLVTRHDLEAGTSYAIRDYPLMIRSAAHAWAQQ